MCVLCDPVPGVAHRRPQGVAPAPGWRIQWLEPRLYWRPAAAAAAIISSQWQLQRQWPAAAAAASFQAFVFW